MEGSEGVHVRQWEWPEGKEPEPQGEALEQAVEAWMDGKRDEAGKCAGTSNLPSLAVFRSSLRDRL